MKNIILPSELNTSLHLTCFECDNPKAVIQVMHGMEEHQKRYYPFAEALNKAGYIVITGDMRGHGHALKKEELGFFADKNGSEILIQDQKNITKFIETNYPNLPIYIYAHSMGTITCRNLLQTYDDHYKKVILSGLPYYQSASKFGVILANIICKFKGTRTKGKFLKKMTTGGFNSKVRGETKTPIDWLSHSEENVKNYLADEYCGFGFTNSGYRDLITLLSHMGDKKRYQVKNKDLRINAFVGDGDPCTGYESGVKASTDFLKNLGYKNVDITKFEHMRHEILNEDNSDLVIKKAIEFYDEK